MKEEKIKFRYIYFGLFTILMVIVMFLTDEKAGFIKNLPISGQTVAYFIFMLNSVFYVGLLHIAVKAFFDYIDYPELIKAALKTPNGPSAVFLGLGLFTIGIAIVIAAGVGI